MELASLPTSLLQYGALGILLVVLVRMFKLFEDSMNFIRGQIEQSNIERAGQVEAWVEMLKEWLAVQAKVSEELRASNIQSMEIIQRLRKMNGKE
ncbi:MAG: hypothetical protein DRQ02_01295 [Candidatus Latescibacterota bacterium]|nr:MAG: hypothetical protein DRQ02_01295 [Candidatus Latescibacterota bacterium]